MLATAAQMASYLYPKGEDPEGAFSWWLSPCGGSGLVPDDVKRAFEVLNMIPHDKSSFRKPKKMRKGSGKKGGSGNPRAPVRPQPGGGNNRPPAGSGRRRRRCSIPPHKATQRKGPARNTLRLLSCDRASQTRTEDLIVTSVVYAHNADPTTVSKTCSKQWSQACMHYSSAIRNNGQWATMTCPQEAATLGRRHDAMATAAWQSEHHESWRNEAHRACKTCDMDEWPPAYLLGPNHPARTHAGQKLGQRVRFLQRGENRGAAEMWKSVCVSHALDNLTDAEFRRLVERDRRRSSRANARGDKQVYATGTVPVRPVFTIAHWEHLATPATDDGLWDNPCWPSSIAVNDPGFALLSLDEWYDKNPRAPGRRTKWDYDRDYKKGQNGD